MENPKQEPNTDEQIKQTLLDPRAISKKHDQEGRKITASEITGKRQESKHIRSKILQKENVLEQIEQQALVSRS